MAEGSADHFSGAVVYLGIPWWWFSAIFSGLPSVSEAGGRLGSVSEPRTGTQQGQTLDSVCQSGVKADSDPGPGLGALRGSMWAFSHPLRNHGLSYCRGSSADLSLNSRCFQVTLHI